VTDTNGARVHVGLYADFQHDPSTAVRQIIQDELAAIMVPIGPTPWEMRRIGLDDVSPVSVDPRENAPERWSGSSLSVISTGSAIRAFLAPSLLSPDPQSRTFVFGRAVSRVLAHELYHVLARTKHHGSSGLGEAFYTPRELAADDFQFQDRETQRVRLAISPALSQYRESAR
jgi:hypothetical protein